MLSQQSACDYSLLCRSTKKKVSGQKEIQNKQLGEKMSSRKLSVPAKAYARREVLIVKEIVPLRRLLLHTGTQESLPGPDPTQLDFHLAERDA